MKKQHNALTLANLELDRRLFNELKELGVVQTKTELSYLCGKTASYYACMRHKGFGVQIGSLAFLISRLSRKVDDETDAERCVKIKLAIQVIKQTIDEKCRLRELEIRYPQRKRKKHRPRREAVHGVNP